ncbi:MAG: ABC transporter substrate-binding protein [Acidobacteriota bacterium]
MQSQKKFFNRRIVAILIAAVVIATIAFVLYRWNNNQPKLKKITIAQAGDFFLYAPLYIAKDAGLFEKKGLDVSLVSTGGDDKTWAAIIGGSAQFGVADPTFVAISDKRGQPGRVVASVVNGVPFWGITFNPKILPITDPKEIGSYGIATFPAPSTAYTLQKEMFQRAGLTPNIREGAFGTLIAMLKAGKADIALELEPNVSQAVMQGAHIVYAMPDIYGDFAITGLTTTPDLIGRDHQLIEDVVCCLQQALDFARTRPEETLRILSARFPEIEPQVAKAALDRALKAGIIPRDVSIAPSAWAKAIEVRVKVGDLSSPKGMEAYVDNTFAIRAESNCKGN